MKENNLTLNLYYKSPTVCSTFLRVQKVNLPADNRLFVDPNSFQKMLVKLAAQLLSYSMSATI